MSVCYRQCGHSSEVVVKRVPVYITYIVTFPSACLPVLNVASLELGPTPAMLMVETVSVYSVSSSSPAKVS